MTSRINKDTQLCMSLSARPGNFGTRFQNFLYERLGLNFIYKAFTTTDIRAAIGGIRALGIRGCAISMPFKESCIEFLDELDDSAKKIQAVNTILNTQGRLRGSNTDYVAIRQLLQKSELPLETSFALFGSGGMAKAVACALRDIGFENGSIVARNEKTGRNLADHYGFQWDSTLRGTPRLLINASPIGMAGTPPEAPEEKSLPFSEEAISLADTIFDVVAIPVETPLIQLARTKNKKVITGFEVITLQALEQFTLYTGVRPDLDLVKEAAAFAKH